MIISELNWHEGDERLSFTHDDNSCGDDGNQQFLFHASSARPEDTGGLSRTCHYGWLRNNGQLFSPTRIRGTMVVYTPHDTLLTWLSSFTSSTAKLRPSFHIGLVHSDPIRKREITIRGFTMLLSTISQEAEWEREKRALIGTNRKIKTSILLQVIIWSFMSLMESPVIAIDGSNPSGTGKLSSREKVNAGSWATARSANCWVNRFQCRFLDRSVVVAVVLFDMCDAQCFMSMVILETKRPRGVCTYSWVRRCAISLTRDYYRREISTAG